MSLSSDQTTCPRCGRQNRAGARFCGDCAAPLAADLLGIHPAEGALGDQYMAVRDGSAPTEAALSWLEWKAAHKDDYDWTEPPEVEMDEAEELLLEEQDWILTGLLVLWAWKGQLCSGVSQKSFCAG